MIGGKRMSKTITINPFTRISGFMEIKIDVENYQVKNAYSSGIMYRGFEQMLIGRHPLDVVYFTERICGICSTAHSAASVMALEKALNIEVPQQAKVLRNLIHGCEFLQNHIRHFYLYTTPDFVRGAGINPEGHGDFRLPVSINDRILNNYYNAIEASRMSHQLLAIYGGKAPHNHGIAPGGVSVEVTADNIIKFKSILEKISYFIDTCMVTDVYSISQYYDDCFKVGKGPENFLSYGVFDNMGYPYESYVSPGVFMDGKYEKFRGENIKEDITYSWYSNELLPEPGKINAYSWIKATRYNGAPMEVGPLARLYLSGKYRRGISSMDRTIARVLETQIICNLMKGWIDLLSPGLYILPCPELPDSASGTSFVDTTRGALSHKITIENKKVASYIIITPTMWNGSPRDGSGNLGTIERALIGAPVADENNPVEIGRIVRSFDPCISCGTHLYSCDGKEKYYQI
jgi:Ni,Fe-hydrogenase I large subunit